MDVDALLDSFDRLRRHERVVIENGGRKLDAKLYLPKGEGPFPGLLFNQGFVVKAALGVANFFPRYLTHLGMAVLVPLYDGLLGHRVITHDPNDAVAAFEYLRSREDIIPGRVGMLGLSYGGLLSLVAAEDSRISRQVRYVVSVGAPTDMRSLMMFCLCDRRASKWSCRLMETSLRKGLADEMGHAAGEELAALRDDERILAEMFGCADASRVDGLIAGLGQRSQEMFDLFSPTQRASDLRARVLHLHGRDDNYVPFFQAEMMHQAILAAGGKSELLPVEGLGHVIFVSDLRAFVKYARTDGRSMLNEIHEFMRR